MPRIVLSDGELKTAIQNDDVETFTREYNKISGSYVTHIWEAIAKYDAYRISHSKSGIHRQYIIDQAFRDKKWKVLKMFLHSFYRCRELWIDNLPTSVVSYLGTIGYVNYGSVNGWKTTDEVYLHLAWGGSWYGIANFWNREIPSDTNSFHSLYVQPSHMLNIDPRRLEPIHIEITLYDNAILDGFDYAETDEDLPLEGRIKYPAIFPVIHRRMVSGVHGRYNLRLIFNGSIRYPEVFSLVVKNRVLPPEEYFQDLRTHSMRNKLFEDAIHHGNDEAILFLISKGVQPSGRFMKTVKVLVDHVKEEDLRDEEYDSDSASGSGEESEEENEEQ